MIRITPTPLLLTTLIGFGLSAFADPNETKSPNYSPVPTAQARSLDTKNYLRFPGWSNIEIIKEGAIDPKLSEQIETTHWSENAILSQLKWLQIRDFDVKVSQILATSNSHLEIIIPFAVGVRYQENGTVSQTFAQGTINVEGMIILTFQNGAVVDIRIEHYDDSQEVERWGRKLGAIDQYDGEFIKGVITRPLKNYLSEPNSQENLIKLLKTHGIQFSPVGGRYPAE
jgi:hypothetical protein